MEECNSAALLHKHMLRRADTELHPRRHLVTNVERSATPPRSSRHTQPPGRLPIAPSVGPSVRLPADACAPRTDRRDPSPSRSSASSRWTRSPPVSEGGGGGAQQAALAGLVGDSGR